MSHEIDRSPDIRPRPGLLNQMGEPESGDSHAGKPPADKALRDARLQLVPKTAVFAAR